MLQPFLLILLGIFTGTCSGVFGIGGGVVLVPALVLLMGLGQHAANGTSLVAMLLPTGMLGAIEYYRSGKIGTEHIKIGLLIAFGMLIGAALGSKYATSISEASLRKAFAVFLGFIAIRLWWLNR